MEQVEVIGSKIIVRELMLEDQEAAHILGELKPEEQSDVVKQALRLGLILRRQVAMAVNIDFVRLEFQNLRQVIEKYWKDEVVSKIDKTITDHFDATRGTVPQQLARYFGDGQERGKLAALFDETNTGSVTYQLRELVRKELTGEDSAFLKALNPDDDNSPVGRLRKKLEDVKDAVIGKKAAEAVAEVGTQKGGPYEDLVFAYIDRIAASFRDKAEDVSNQNVAGDYVVSLDAEAIPGQSIRLAIDAKDKSMGLKACEDTLRETKSRWNAQAALLVFAREEQTPFSPPIGLRKLSEGYVCVFSKEDLDSRILQASYQVTRLDAVRSVQRSQIQVDVSVLQEKLEQAVQKLQEFVTLKRKLTASINELGNIRQFIDTLHREFLEKLEEAWNALGLRTPMPTTTEETELAR